MQAGISDYFSCHYSGISDEAMVIANGSLQQAPGQQTPVEKAHLKLSHLPSKQGIKGPYPRTPSSVGNHRNLCYPVS